MHSNVSAKLINRFSDVLGYIFNYVVCCYVSMSVFHSCECTCIAGHSIMYNVDIYGTILVRVTWKMDVFAFSSIKSIQTFIFHSMFSTRLTYKRVGFVGWVRCLIWNEMKKKKHENRPINNLWATNRLTIECHHNWWLFENLASLVVGNDEAYLLIQSIEKQYLTIESFVII